jgi:phage/plasmid-like protein (TIGR03299 family)
MAHDFTSGVMLNGTAAWHGLGQVIEGTLPARDAFVRAQALFPVEKLALWAGDPTNPTKMISLSDERVGIWRPDERKILGTASPSYRIISNDTLLRFAEAIREEVDMDTVIVLRGGAKVAFTAKLRGTNQEVVPGDTIHRNIVGYLGHDGKTAFGGMFTDIRVVCANTLGFAQSDANRTGKQFTIKHTENDIAQIDGVLGNINMARQQFAQVVDDYRALHEVPMNTELFRHWLESVYQVPAVKTDDGERPGRIEDMPRKWAQLEQAWHHGLGRDIPGVSGTAYWGLNAVTEVESSQRTAGSGKRRLHSALFGSGSSVIKRANELAMALI